MGDTSIEWTHLPGHKGKTWTPIRARNTKSGKVGWHCEHASAGCKHCYSDRRNLWIGTGLPFKPGHMANGDVEMFLDETMLLAPLRWRDPCGVFVCSMTDLFGEFVPAQWIARVFAVMMLTPKHIYMVLTKRSARMRELLADPDFRALVARMADEMIVSGAVKVPPEVAVRIQYVLDKHWAGGQKPFDVGPWPLPNVWLGVSAEDQPAADYRIPDLLGTPAAIRFVSYEPALGPVDFTQIDDGLRDGTRLVFDALTGLAHDGHDTIEGVFGNPDPKLDWIIAGGESGPYAWPAHPDWFRSVRDQCAAAGVPFLFKQWGAWAPGAAIGALEERDITGRGAVVQGWPRRYVVCEDRADRLRAYAFGRDAAPWVYFVGKKRAGRLLDGVEHNGFPKGGRYE